MKTHHLFAALLLLIAGAEAAMAQSLVVSMKGNRTKVYSLLEVDNICFSDSNIAGGHEWVDLDLPSGTLWASCNVGANSPEEFGNYFAWGETEPKENYCWETYKYCKGSSSTLTRYCNQSQYGYNGFTDNLTELLPEDDAATANWGNEWMTPSKAQYEELFNDGYTVVEQATENDVKGKKITSKRNGNSIFIPNAGYGYNTDIYPSGSTHFWMSSFSDRNPYSAYYSGENTSFRCNGLTVRPVRVREQGLVRQIILNKTALYLAINTSEQITATVLPQNANYKNVVWESSDETVATVSSGLVTALSDGTCYITCRATDGSRVYGSCYTTVRRHDTKEGVDLGLPSGTLWATCNVGASSPEEFGDYFAWGETAPKNEYTERNYKYCDNGSILYITKYVVQNPYRAIDNLTELLPEDDAATVNWGSEWKTPSKDQVEELFYEDFCSTEFTTLNGVNGLRVTSKMNGNSIFLPNAGCYAYYNTFLPNEGVYWARDLDVSDDYNRRAFHFWFQTNIDYNGSQTRFYGISVRPVKLPVYEIKLSATEIHLSLNDWDGYELRAYTQDNVPYYDVIWESSNVDVADIYVDEDGVAYVCPIDNGTCTITCRAKYDHSIKAECKVYVED